MPLLRIVGLHGIIGNILDRVSDRHPARGPVGDDFFDGSKDGFARVDVPVVRVSLLCLRGSRQTFLLNLPGLENWERSSEGRDSSGDGRSNEDFGVLDHDVLRVGTRS